MKMIATATAFIFALAAPAAAETLMSNDFQNMGDGGWKQASDRGGVGTSDFKGNVSFRVTGGAAATNSVSTLGWKDVTISMAVAALDLGAHGGCFADASIDGGANWIRVGRAGTASSNGVTLMKISNTLPELANQQKVTLRLSNSGPAESNCWFDNYTVSATNDGSAGPRAAVQQSASPGAVPAAPAPTGSIMWDPSSVPSGPAQKPK
jgi:hypothetical protein